ncbi:hypothetical protein C8Q76DRAFT_689195 [Earliella scabrosa]|nr:hypothetical protein C8Q76DRAFT_689195 [Earliella scabrosa]
MSEISGPGTLAGERDGVWRAEREHMRQPTTARSVRAAQRLTGLDEREAKKVGGRQTAGGECAHQLGANTPLAWTAPSFFTRISFSPVRLLGSSHSSCTSCGATRDQVQRAWAVHTPGEKRWDRTGKILTKFPEDLSPAPAPTLPAVGGWCYLSSWARETSILLRMSSSSPRPSSGARVGPRGPGRGRGRMRAGWTRTTKELGRGRGQRRLASEGEESDVEDGDWDRALSAYPTVGPVRLSFFKGGPERLKLDLCGSHSASKRVPRVHEKLRAVTKSCPPEVGSLEVETGAGVGVGDEGEDACKSENESASEVARHRGREEQGQGREALTSLFTAWLVAGELCGVRSTEHPSIQWQPFVLGGVLAIGLVLADGVEMEVGDDAKSELERSRGELRGLGVEVEVEVEKELFLEVKVTVGGRDLEQARAGTRTGSGMKATSWTSTRSSSRSS